MYRRRIDWSRKFQININKKLFRLSALSAIVCLFVLFLMTVNFSVRHHLSKPTQCFLGCHFFFFYINMLVFPLCALWPLVGHTHFNFKLKRAVGGLGNITLFVRTLVEFRYPIEWWKIQFFILDWNTKGTLNTLMILQDFFYRKCLPDYVGLPNSFINQSM